MSTNEIKNIRKPNTSIARNELVALTGDVKKAIILGAFLEWAGEAGDFDKYLNGKSDFAWISKSLEQIGNAAKLELKKTCIMRLVEDLINKGFITKRVAVSCRNYKKYMYKVELGKIIESLNELGFELEGDGIQNWLEDIDCGNRSIFSQEFNLAKNNAWIGEEDPECRDDFGSETEETTRADNRLDYMCYLMERMYEVMLHLAGTDSEQNVTFCNVTERHRTLQNVTDCNDMERYVTLQNVTDCNDMKRYRTLQNVTNRYKTLQNVTDCNDMERYVTLQNVTNRYKTLQNDPLDHEEEYSNSLFDESDNLYCISDELDNNYYDYYTDNLEYIYNNTLTDCVENNNIPVSTDNQKYNNNTVVNSVISDSITNQQGYSNSKVVDSVIPESITNDKFKKTSSSSSSWTGEGGQPTNPSGKSERQKAEAADVEKAVDLWNSLDGLGNIKAIRRLAPGTEREKSLRARLKEYGLEAFEEAIENIKDSKFLQGFGDKGWCISLEWLVKPNNFPKVLEGKYSDGGSRDSPGSQGRRSGNTREPPVEMTREEIIKERNKGLDEFPRLDDPDYEENMAKHPIDEGWLVNDDGYWVNKKLGIGYG